MKNRKPTHTSPYQHTTKGLTYQLLPFSTTVIGKKAKSIFSISLQEHHTSRWLPRPTRGKTFIWKWCETSSLMNCYLSLASCLEYCHKVPKQQKLQPPWQGPQWYSSIPHYLQPLSTWPIISSNSRHPCPFSCRQPYHHIKVCQIQQATNSLQQYLILLKQ